jgi:transposase
MSERKERRKYNREFKIEAVQLYESSGKSMRAIEQELGITPFLLAKWVQEFRQGETRAFPGKGRLPAEEAELQRLRRENEVLRQERDILKKVVAIFSKPKA